MRYAIAIVGTFTALSIASRAIMLRAPASIARDRAQPLIVVTNWHGFGLLLWCTLAIAVAAAFYAYLKVIRAERSPKLWIVVATAAGALLAGMLVPVVFSSDVYAYAAYGELARLGADPYVYRWPSLQHDELLRLARWQWGVLPACVYGPAFVAIARGIVTAAAGAGAAVQLNLLRICAAVALLACAPLAAIAFGRRKGVRAAAIVALNPVALWCAAEGHNDALMLAIVLAGIALLRRYPAIGAALVALAATIKAPAAIASAGVALDAVRRKRAIPSTWSGTIGGAIIVAIVSMPLINGVTHDLAPRGHYLPQVSLQALLYGIVAAATHDARVEIAMVVAGVALVGGTLAWHGVSLLRRRSIEGWAYLAAAAWFAIPNPYPWYGVWLLPLCALGIRTPIAATLLLLGASAMLRYIADAVGALNAQMQFVLAMFAVAPLLIFAVRRSNAPPYRTEP